MTVVGYIDSLFCSGTYKCIECPEGFRINGTELCADIDECSNLESACHENAKCTNTVGSFTCACNQNYFGNGFFCVTGQCDDTSCPKQNQKCRSPTTVDCKCKNGFYMDEFDECVDIDECTTARVSGQFFFCFSFFVLPLSILCLTA